MKIPKWGKKNLVQGNNKSFGNQRCLEQALRIRMIYKGF